MAFHASDIDGGWRKLGLTLKPGKRHLQALLFVNGKLILRTYRSRGSGEVSESDLIRQQMRLNDDQFGDMVKCPLRRRGYLEILLERKALDRGDFHVEFAPPPPPGQSQ